MEPDDLSQRKKALEDSIDGFGRWMIGFTSPVAIGLLMETYAIFQLRLTVAWNPTIDRVGLILVAAGVVGELVIEVMVHRMERKLRTVNAEIEREADAKLKAADERIAALQLETERLRKENLEVARFLEDRALGDVFEFQQAMFRFRSTRFAIRVGDAPESRSLAVSIKHALAEAEWVPDEPMQRATIGEGVWVMEHGPDGFLGEYPCSEAAKALTDWLNENGVAAMTFVREDLEPGKVFVSVGPKPTSPQRYKYVQEEREKQKSRRLGDPKPGGLLSPDA